MLVGIHKDPYGDFEDFLIKFETILDHNNIDHVRMEASQPDFWEIIPKPQFFLLLAVLVIAAGVSTMTYLFFLKKSVLREEIAKV